MAVLTATGVHVAYGDAVVLDHLDLAIQDGERVGLVGRNGGGKSTLAGVLCGAIVPDAGTVTLRNGAQAAYLPQQPRLADDARARDVVRSGLALWSQARADYEAVTEALGRGDGDPESLVARQAQLAAQIEAHGGWDPDHRVERITQRLGITRLDGAVGTMSGGERRRVDLARVLIAQPDLAILDEPTNHLDVDTIEWLEDLLATDYRGALLLITHDRYILDRVVTRTLELSRGQLASYEGGWEAYLAGKAEREAHAARAESNRQNLMRRELDWLRRSPKARTTKSKSRIQRAEALIADRPPDADRDVRAISVTRTHSGKTAFQLDHLGVDAWGKTLIDDLDLIVADGERIGIVGPNGAGKTTLLKVLLGRAEPTRGAVRVSPHTRIAYFDQERTRLDDDRTVMENVCDNRETVEVAGQAMSVHSYLSRFLFDGSKARQRVSTLSGGERARVQLAKFLLEPANVLILDEPTNDLDVGTLAAVEELIESSGLTVLLVTHDRYFLDRVAGAILSFEGDGRVVRYEGSYQAFRAQREQARTAAPSPAAAPSAPAVRTSAPPRKTGLTFTEKHELERMMPLIEAAETEVARLEAALADPELYVTRAAEAPGIIRSLDAARAVLDERLARWEQLELKREDS